jgi:hypothetical protein
MSAPIDVEVLGPLTDVERALVRAMRDHQASKDRLAEAGSRLCAEHEGDDEGLGRAWRKYLVSGNSKGSGS